jgi:UDP-N-acetyl-D-mannosaminuronic acid transferase (WecB/TagA/CpsF family)
MSNDGMSNDGMSIVYWTHRHGRQSAEPDEMLPKIMSLKGKTVFITGASRGIGLAIGIMCAKNGMNV